MLCEIVCSVLENPDGAAKTTPTPAFAAEAEIAVLRRDVETACAERVELRSQVAVLTRELHALTELRGTSQY